MSLEIKQKRYTNCAYTLPYTVHDSGKMFDYPDNSMLEQECTMLNKVAEKYLVKKYAVFHFNWLYLYISHWIFIITFTFSFNH